MALIVIVAALFAVVESFAEVSARLLMNVPVPVAFSEMSIDAELPAAIGGNMHVRVVVPVHDPLLETVRRVVNDGSGICTAAPHAVPAALDTVMRGREKNEPFSPLTVAPEMPSWTSADDIVWKRRYMPLLP